MASFIVSQRTECRVGSALDNAAAESFNLATQTRVRKAITTEKAG